MENINYKRAALYALIAYFFFALGMICFKMLTFNYPLYQILAAECLVALPLYLVLAKCRGGFADLKTHYPFKQFIRGFLQTLASLCSFWALNRLPLSTLTMITYVSPLIITLLAIPFLKEKCPPLNLAVILVGLGGVVLVAQPEAGNIAAVGAVLLSCFFWAGNALMMRTMDKDKTITFPFYTVLAGGIVWPIVTVFGNPVPFIEYDLIYAILAGLLCFTGAQLLFSSYRLAPFYFTTPFQYTQLIWVVLAGWLIWADVPTSVQIIGVSILVITNLWLVVSQKQKVST